MDMGKWEFLAMVGVVGVLLGLPAAVFGAQSYREAQERPGLASRPASLLPAGGDSVSGRQVFVGKCSACHGQVGEGSVAGPDIRNMSVGPQFVYAWIMDPSGVTPIATMPRVPLTEKEATDVTAYVMGLREGKTLADVVPPRQEAPASGEKAISSAAGDAAKGKATFASKGCSACHGANGEGTVAAPSLKGFPADKLKDQVRGPKGKMPPFGTSQLSDSEIADLAAFVATLK